MNRGQHQAVWYLYDQKRFHGLGIYTTDPMNNGMDRRIGRFTTSELCQRLRSYSSVQRVQIDNEGNVPSADYSDDDIEAIGQALHCLKFGSTLRFAHITAEKVSAFLRYVPKPKIRKMYLRFPEQESSSSRISAIASELRRDDMFCGYLEIIHAYLDHGDCESLAHWVRSLDMIPRHRVFLSMWTCTFSSVTGYLLVATADSLDRDFCTIFGRTKETHGKSIFYSSYPRVAVDTSFSLDRDFCTIFGRTKETYAARKHLYLYEKLILAGRMALKKNDNAEDWVNALCQESVRYDVDVLFCFLLMNPDLYAKAALLGRAERGNKRSRWMMENV